MMTWRTGCENGQSVWARRSRDGDADGATATMVKRGRSLADEISSLLDTRPADPTGADEALNDDDDEDARELLAPEDRPTAMGARRMRGAGIDLGELGSKYAGKVTSRAKLEREELRRTPYEQDDEDEEHPDPERLLVIPQAQEHDTSLI